MTFEEGLIQVLMDPDRLRRERVQSETEVADHEAQHDREAGPYVPHHHHAVYEGSRH